MTTISRTKAVEVVRVVANRYNITDAFDLFDDSMIEHKLNVLAGILKSNPVDRQGNARCPVATWFSVVEDELGIDPGDPHEVREYQTYLREVV